jgi:hypothetical protein
MSRTPRRLVISTTYFLPRFRTLALVDEDWLRREAEKGHLLPEAFLTEPLHVTGSIRFDDRPRAQRFARMLLVTQDHIRKHDRLDFFDPATRC